MTTIDFIKSYLHFLEPLFRYRHAYKNYVSVLLNVIRKKYPIEVILRNNGKHLRLNTKFEVFLTTFDIEKCYEINDDYITIKKKDQQPVKLYDAVNNGDIFSVFLREDYKCLPVKGSIVVDVGANIGDSAVYFASHGAKKVISLEPYPKNYESAKKNITLNNFSDKIDLLLAGCSSKKGEITINTEEGNAGSMLIESQSGTKIPLLTLEDIVNLYKLDSALLKIDCEGCEYDIILSSSKETLKKFSHIVIDYHFGYKNIKEKLEKCGFQVSYSKVHFNPGRNGLPNMYGGEMYASQS